MKVTLYLLVILTTAFAVPEENQHPKRELEKIEMDPDACEAKCTDEEKKMQYICTDGGPFAYPNPCKLKCNPLGHKEIECAPGSLGACMNLCTPEEWREDRGMFCDVRNDRFVSECDAKCRDTNYSNNEVAPCKN